MKTPPVKFTAKLELYAGDAPWHFITVPLEESDVIKELYIWPRRGFGSIPVNVTIGKTTWKTSIFPQKDQTFFLPIKKQIRVTENLKVGGSTAITLEVRN